LHLHQRIQSPGLVKGAERSIRIHTDASSELVADCKMKEDLKKSSHATLMKFFQDPQPGRTRETHFRSFTVAAWQVRL
jgi:hypothetical protein